MGLCRVGPCSKFSDSHRCNQLWYALRILWSWNIPVQQFSKVWAIMTVWHWLSHLLPWYFDPYVCELACSKIWPTLFFNHQSLDLTLSDLCKSERTVSPDKPMGQLRAPSYSVVEAQSLTNRGKSLGIVWKFAHGRSLGQYFPDNPYGFSTVCTKLWVRLYILTTVVYEQLSI